MGEKGGCFSNWLKLCAVLGFLLMVTIPESSISPKRHKELRKRWQLITPLIFIFLLLISGAKESEMINNIIYVLLIIPLVPLLLIGLLICLWRGGKASGSSGGGGCGSGCGGGGCGGGGCGGGG